MKDILLVSSLIFQNTCILQYDLHHHLKVQSIKHVSLLLQTMRNKDS